jgi:cytochrome c
MNRMFCLAALAIATSSMMQPASAQGDAENGKELFLRACRGCHQVGEGAKNGIGPSLNGIIGRKAGTINDFNYSEANKQAGGKGLVWSEKTLFEYLRDPAAFMPGNKMTYAGVKDDDDRHDIIAYLKQHSK